MLTNTHIAELGNVETKEARIPRLLGSTPAST